MTGKFQIISRLLGIMAIFCLALAAYAEFSDVPATHENADAIAYVELEGIVEGYADGTYQPDQPINRAEFTKIIIGTRFALEEIEKCMENNAAAPDLFSDVPANAWFAPYICLAKAEAIVSGYPDQTYRPEQSIAFVEAAKIIVNAFGYQSPEDPLIWYKPFVEILAENKAIPGSITTFAKNITRGEMAEMIYRLETAVTDKPSVTYAQLTGTALGLPEACVAVPDRGPCRGFFTRYYFDVNSGSCAEFGWGGCAGTVPFTSLNDCTEACVSAPAAAPDPCTLEPDTGLCKAAFPRYYFDPEQGCTEFTWGGCGGTVPFESLGACQSSCVNDPGNTAADETFKEFAITAQAWEFIPNAILVEQGDAIRLTITSTDIEHGFALPAFEINEHLFPQNPVTIEFTADQVGEFEFFSSVFSGAGYHRMRGTFIVEE